MSGAAAPADSGGYVPFDNDAHEKRQRDLAKVERAVDHWFRLCITEKEKAGIEGIEHGADDAPAPTDVFTADYPFSPSEASAIAQHPLANNHWLWHPPGQVNTLAQQIVWQRRALNLYHNLAHSCGAALRILFFVYASALRIDFPQALEVGSVVNAVQQAHGGNVRMQHIIAAPFQFLSRMSRLVRYAILRITWRDEQMTARTHETEAVYTHHGRRHEQPTTTPRAVGGPVLLSVSQFLDKIMDYDTYVNDALRDFPKNFIGENTVDVEPMTIHDFRLIANVASPTRPLPPHGQLDDDANNVGSALGGTVDAYWGNVVWMAIAPRLALPLQSVCFMIARGVSAFDLERRNYMGIISMALPVTLSQLHYIALYIKTSIANPDGARPAGLDNFMQFTARYAAGGIYPIELDVARWYAMSKPDTMFAFVVDLWAKLLMVKHVTGEFGWIPYTEPNNHERTMLPIQKNETTGATRRQRAEV